MSSFPALRALPLLALAALGGCYSLSPVKVDSALEPQNDAQAGYLVGVLGKTPEGANGQALLIRKRGTDQVARVQVTDTWALKTRHDLDGRDWSSPFAIALQPGQYELYNVNFTHNGYQLWKKDDFSIPVTISAGKAAYIGNFRASCFQNLTSACYFLRRDQLAKDSAALKGAYPQLPAIEEAKLSRLDNAAPIIVDQGTNPKLFQVLQGGK